MEQAVKALKSGTSFAPPMVLAKFWRQIGGVSFVDLNEYTHCEFWEKHGITAQYCDGVVIDGCSEEWVEYVVSDYTERKEDDYPFDESPFYFELSPDGYHKDNISGGAPYGLAPGGGWVSLWKNFEWVDAPASSHSRTDFFGLPAHRHTGVCRVSRLIR